MECYRKSSHAIYRCEYHFVGGGPQNLDNVLSTESAQKERSWHEQQTEKKYSATFKTKVALIALKNQETTAELAQRFGVHWTMIGAWKRVLLDGTSN